MSAVSGSGVRPSSSVRGTATGSSRAPNGSVGVGCVGRARTSSVIRMPRRIDSVPKLATRPPDST